MEYIKPNANRETPFLEINNLLTGIDAPVDSVTHTLAGYIHDQKLESFSLMAGGAAHDFKNLLTVIAANADLIKHAVTKTEIVLCTDQIMDVCRKASHLAGNLMSMFKSDGSSQVPVDLSREAEKTVAFLRGAIPKNIRLETDFSKEPVIISGDPTQICQVLINLMKNALEAIKGEGNIAIVSRKMTLKQYHGLKNKNARAGKFAVLSVADSGDGIPENIISKIYDPFFSTKKKCGNSGFGLAIVSEIADRHDGWINVESHVGSGACFSVYFPLHSDQRRA